MKNIYLDNASTTPLSQEVKDYIISILDMYGNPSSVHSVGASAKQVIETARKNVAKFIGINDFNDLSSQIIFTSSGSAANNLALIGVEKNIFRNRFCYYSPTSHKSMISAIKSFYMANHFRVNQSTGLIDLSYLKSKLEYWNKYENNACKYKCMVCFEAANSEIGTVQDIKKIISFIHEYNGMAIVDFTGYIPYAKVDVKELDVDIATFSGHKLHALKGVGVLYKKKDIELEPLIYGSQEQGLFGGTENIIGIASLGKACELYDYSNINTFNRDYLKDKILNSVPDCYLIGSQHDRLPCNLNFCFKKVDGEALLLLLDMNGIQVSTGSACNSGSMKPSETLKAIGIPDSDIHSCIRMTLSGKETIEELDYVADKIKECVLQLRAL